jgi:hypothetical protein
MKIKLVLNGNTVLKQTKVLAKHDARLQCMNLVLRATDVTGTE